MGFFRSFSVGFINFFYGAILIQLQIFEGLKKSIFRQSVVFMKVKQKIEIILASQSPRRKELLSSLGLDFEQISKDVNEDYPSSLDLDSIPEFLAVKKAKAYSSDEVGNCLLICSDTIVIQEGKVLGKPKNREEGVKTLCSYSNSSHKVITGVALRTSDGIISFSEESNVFFNHISKEEAEAYYDTCDPSDKAGSYGIQEWLGYAKISKIDGSYSNVMGLPTARLYEELNRLGYC